MAERKIRCLNSQVKSIRCKSLNCKPKQWNEYDSDDDDAFHFALEQSTPSRSDSRGRRSMDLVAAEKGWISPLAKSKRPTSQPPSTLICSRCQSHDRGVFRSMDDTHQAFHTGGSGGGGTPKRSGGTRGGSKELDKIAAKELLGASLHSLEQLHRRNSRGGHEPHETSSGLDSSYLPHSILQDSYGTPSAEYLKGALWLGRNIHMLTEDLVEQLDSFRTKYLREVSILSRGGDSNQATSSSASTSHRLSLLAASGITETITIAYNARTKSRKMLQQASALAPGDQEGLHRLMMDLPVESMLTRGFLTQDSPSRYS
jgi:hypothetical protein